MGARQHDCCWSPVRLCVMWSCGELRTFRIALSRPFGLRPLSTTLSVEVSLQMSNTSTSASRPGLHAEQLFPPATCVARIFCIGICTNSFRPVAPCPLRSCATVFVAFTCCCICASSSCRCRRSSSASTRELHQASSRLCARSPAPFVQQRHSRRLVPVSDSRKIQNNYKICM